ncbi:MAG: hypothetical protein LBV04_05245 [Deferribacteraceae bacterium]|nr:hypothetical protein [Deferribacteraceae bacterium]
MNIELFDEENNKKYSQEILVNAYENIVLEVLENGEAEYNFPDGDFFYIKSDYPKEDIDKIIKDIFLEIYVINSFVQQETNQYQIAGFKFCNNVITVEFWGLKVNTQFDVEIYKERYQWYCTKIGLIQYAYPVCINDFPHGYDHSNFEKEKKVNAKGFFTHWKVLN